MRNIAILLASGSGSRVGGDIPKQFLKVGDKYVFEYSLRTFNDYIGIDEVVLVARADYMELVRSVVRDGKYNKVVRVVPGGETRQESVSNGIFTIGHDEGNVLIHDTARPFVTKGMIERVLGALESCSAVSTVLPATDTMFKVDEVDRVEDVPDRTFLRRVQTPQGFYLSTIKKAHYMAIKEDLTLATDDCSLIRHFGLGDIYTVKGDDLAFKITTPLDLVFAQSIADNLTVLYSD